MRLVAFDIETTGLDPQKDQILQMAAVVFDPVNQISLGEFDTLVCHSRYEGDAFALQMNAGILKRLAKGEGHSPSYAYHRLHSFLTDHQALKSHAVGFNVGKFDLAFLRRIHIGPDTFHHRTIELGSLLSQDGLPVSSKEATVNCLGREVTHDALQDCRDAAELYSLWYKERCL
jgi:oligoribonuclease (3'-5' exoribonuclease)